MFYEFGYMVCKIFMLCCGDEVDCGGVISGISFRICVVVVFIMCRGENFLLCRVSKCIFCSYVGCLVYCFSFDG